MGTFVFVEVHLLEALSNMVLQKNINIYFLGIRDPLEEV